MKDYNFNKYFADVECLVLEKEPEIPSFYNEERRIEEKRERRKKYHSYLDIKKHTITEPVKSNILQNKFDLLSRQWRNETGGMSTIKDKITHPNYLLIIALGSDVVPYILNDLKKYRSFWYKALETLLNENLTIPKEKDFDNFETLRLAWIKWGKENRYIS
jgi:hypothetical protein